VRGEEKEYGQEGQKPSRFIMFKDETKLWMFGKPKDIQNNEYKAGAYTRPLLSSTGAFLSFKIRSEHPINTP